MLDEKTRDGQLSSRATRIVLGGEVGWEARLTKVGEEQSQFLNIH
jgi:hypothetical protein